MPVNLPEGTKIMNNMDKVKIISIGADQSQAPINFMDGLTLLFIGLKLTGHMDDWTWVAVLAPLWGPIMVGWFIRLVITTFFKQDEEEE